MGLLIIGSVAYDSIKTPFGAVDKVLGGSALYSSLSASFFTPVGLVAVVGEDFPKSEIEYLNSKGINTDGLIVKPGKTFFWKGEYSYNLNEPTTLDTQLNVFADFKPELTSEMKKSEYVFLANIDPDIQLELLNQLENPKFVALDTMNLWIKLKRESLLKVINRVNALIINEGEIRQLMNDHNILSSAKKLFDLANPLKYLIIKRGEYGVLFFEREKPNNIFALPSYPIEIVKDPTGAGDSFAGGFMGFISKVGTLDEMSFRKAVVIGTVMASINVEDFSFNRFRELKDDEITERLNSFRNVVYFEEVSPL